MCFFPLHSIALALSLLLNLNKWMNEWMYEWVYTHSDRRHQVSWDRCSGCRREILLRRLGLWSLSHLAARSCAVERGRCRLSGWTCRRERPLHWCWRIRTTRWSVSEATAWKSINFFLLYFDTEDIVLFRQGHVASIYNYCLYSWAEMYAGRVACCTWVGHSECADGTDRRTDRWTPDRYITLSARRGQRYKRYKLTKNIT